MKQKLKYIDLFAGCGGLSLGLYNSGCWHGKFAVEKNAAAFKTLEHNLINNQVHFSWPDILAKSNHDINSLLEKHHDYLVSLRGQIDLVAGGPPCQGFSLAGRRKEKDQRNNLVHSYLAFIELVQPKAVFFENVKGFKIGFKNDGGSRGIPYSEVVLSTLRDMGYEDAEARIINFSKYGVPQERKRCIIFGTLAGGAPDFFHKLEKNSFAFLASKDLKTKPNLRNAISDLQRKYGDTSCPECPSFRAGFYSKNVLSPYQRLMRKGVRGTPNSHRFAKHSPAIEQKFKTIISENLTSKDVRERFKTRKSSTKLLQPSQPSPTLTTLPDDYVHYHEPRILTVREYARIQSFPDWYVFKGPYTTGGPRRKNEVPRYSQIGNAIPPLFAEQVGHAIWNILNEST